MALGRTYTTALTGVRADIVSIEANIGPGLPGIYIVGMADTAISEARDRIRTAVMNSGLSWPKTKIILSLSPASLPKSGAHLDLAMVVAVLTARAEDPEVDSRLQHTLLLGEVGLDGSIKPVPGILPGLLAAREHGYTRILVPPGNAVEATLLEGVEVLLAPTLRAVHSWVTGVAELPPLDSPGELALPENIPDMADIAGQPEARFAAEVAATGGHHMLMTGPPGSGKSMIAARLPGLLPPLDPDQVIEASTVHSVVGSSFQGAVRRAPFIAPHHSISRSALLGGGSGHPVPGAVSLAHHGVLFLDEVSEIPAGILDSLRTPLEQGCVRMLRSRREVVFPASFQLVMAANPCRCAAEEAPRCRCTPRQRSTYLNNLSGPLRDRIDIRVRTSARGAVISTGDAESTVVIAERVAVGRERAHERWSRHGLGHLHNAIVDPHVLRRYFPADDAAMALLGAYLGDAEVSQRGVDRALKLAWTLCDLDGGDLPNLDHMARALDLHGSSELVEAA
ncbi:YifB family Mg chelatase-like AAA ATPase [Corynebacterium sp. A21]|uniref:YifB family Mg chelatase-like AAA ATPase n=1 Tax=Corynebacterium sp. A21 TaxID=3457318 RepID=UPI003FD61FCD